MLQETAPYCVQQMVVLLVKTTLTKAVKEVQEQALVGTMTAKKQTVEEETEGAMVETEKPYSGQQFQFPKVRGLLPEHGAYPAVHYMLVGAPAGRRHLDFLEELEEQVGEAMVAPEFHQ